VENDDGALEPSAARDRLDSWKEIAAYLKRDVTTVRRWEKREALPVHRHLHEQRESVYAFRDEIDAWGRQRRNHIAEPPLPVQSRSSTRATIAASAAVIAVAAVAGWAVARSSSTRDERRPVRFSIAADETAGDMAFSPDGRALAFVIGSEDKARVFVRPLDSLAAHPLEGTDGAESPFWSPDSRFIAFGSGGKLKTIAAAGGLVRTLCDARVVLGGSWSRDGIIVFAPGNRASLFSIPAGGGTPTPATTLDRSQGHNTHRWPQFLPDGRHFLYLARGPQPERSGIYIGSLDSSAATRIVTTSVKAEYSPEGFLAWLRGRRLVAQPFDLRRLALGAEPLPFVDDIQFSTDDGAASFTLSAHGDLAYRHRPEGPQSQLAWVDRAGHRLTAPELADVAEPSLSSDGTRVAVTRAVAGSTDIWVVDRVRGSSRVTSDVSADLMPIWSPDGSAIVFASNRDGPADLYRTAPDQGGRAEMVFASTIVKHPNDWSRDGRLIVYEANDPETGWDLWVLPLGGKPRAFLRTPLAEHHGRFSPDGRWMAYVSNESGQNEVYVRSFPGAADQSKVSIGGGLEPRWRRDGRELFYVAPDLKLMAVSVRPGAVFQTSLPAPLFDSHMSGNGEWGYDVSPDGREFVLTVTPDATRASPINIVLNWTAALPR
jgi:Tol biopolymer transport system component